MPVPVERVRRRALLGVLYNDRSGGVEFELVGQQIDDREQLVARDGLQRRYDPMSDAIGRAV